MTAAKLIADKFEIWAEIEGIPESVDLTSLTLVWGINQIPTAEITLPVGFKLYGTRKTVKNATTVKNVVNLDLARDKEKLENKDAEQADIAVLSKLPQISIKAKIITNYLPERFSDEPIINVADSNPLGDFQYTVTQTLFTGYVTGFTQTLASDSASWIVTAKHKLSDLLYSSISTASGLAVEFYSRKLPAFNAASQTGVVASNKHLTFINTIFRKIREHKDNLVKGIINGLYIIFKDANKVRKTLPACPLSDVTEIIKSAFNSIITKVRWRSLQSKDGTYNLSGYIPATLGKVIQTQLKAYSELIAEVIEQGGRFDDIWDQLVMRTLPVAELCFIPGVTDAIIVPRLPMVKTAGVSVHKDDILKITVSSSYQQRLRAVSVIGASAASMTGVSGAQLEGKLVGCYLPIKNLIGRIYAVEPAPWIQKLIKHAPTLPNANTDRQEGNAALLGANPPKDQKDKDKEKEGTIEKITDLYNAYAKYIYNEENYSQKSGSATVIPRLDIAPGTTVKFVDDSPGVQESGRYVFAYVNQVMLTIQLTGNAPVAQTVLNLSYVRSLEENDKFALSEHPLYGGEVFTGATLYPSSQGSPKDTIQS